MLKKLKWLYSLCDYRTQSDALQKQNKGSMPNGAEVYINFRIKYIKIRIEIIKKNMSKLKYMPSNNSVVFQAKSKRFQQNLLWPSWAKNVAKRWRKWFWTTSGESGANWPHVTSRKFPSVPELYPLDTWPWNRSQKGTLRFRTVWKKIFYFKLTLKKKNSAILVL